MKQNWPVLLFLAVVLITLVISTLLVYRLLLLGRP